MFDNTRRKRHLKRTRRASPSARRRAHKNDDRVSSDASEDLGDLKPRHKRVRISKGPTPYVEFESVELSDQREQSEPKNFPMLPLVIVAIVAGIALIGAAGHVAKSLKAKFPPGGAIMYKSVTGAGVHPVRPRHALRPGKCSSESCRWQSRYIAQKLNHSVSPCVDFYSYVCSRNWFRKPDASSQPYTYSAHASTMLTVWDFLEQFPAEGSTSFISEAALFMQGCVAGSNEDTNWNAFRKILQTLGIGEWPYGEAPPHAEAHTVAAKAEKMLGVSSLVLVSLRSRPSSHKTMLHVNSPPVLLRRFKNAFPGPYIKSYGEFISKALSLSNPSGQDVHQTVLRILMLEEKISTAAAQSVRNVPVADVTLPISNLTSQPYWDWQAYFEYFIKDNQGRLTRDEVALLDSAYFNDLPNIISRFTVQTILNYVGYKLIVAISPLLPPNEAGFMIVSPLPPSFR
ncbi:hypothetical protein HPB48_014689 [Haemaphysalis longicornis]|uniref:Peptidase M13 N-terminal domain-containing protein n=1 Tax=Haemaphysalis longicornis TaxID=44386 RepID=A0A9J6G863_HAELO|nr:hypothetical protein HPB48_014689 [Haemaphysalis longicornis]